MDRSSGSSSASNLRGSTVLGKDLSIPIPTRESRSSTPEGSRISMSKAKHAGKIVTTSSKRATIQSQTFTNLRLSNLSNNSGESGQFMRNSNHDTSPGMPNRMSMMPNRFSSNSLLVPPNRHTTNQISSNNSASKSRKSIMPSKLSFGSQGTKVGSSAQGGGDSGHNIPVFNPRKHMEKDLKEIDIIYLKQIFDSWDSDGNGLLAPNQIQSALIENGFNINQDTLYDIVAQYDDQEIGGLSFDQFIQIMTTKPEFNETKQQIQAIYQQYDRSNKGYIDINDLKNIVQNIEESCDQATLQQIVENASSNQDNQITFQDFYKLMVADNII